MAQPTRADDRSETAAPSGVSIGSDDMPAQAADWIVGKVDAVKSATTDNAVIAARAVVYGLVIAVLGVTGVVLLTIVLVRMADAYLPIGSGVGDAVWAAYLFIGGLVSILGLGAWASRRGEGSPTGLIVAVVFDVAIVVVVVVTGIIRGVA